MTVTVYYVDGRRSIVELAHEILERPDDIAITYTQLIDNTFRTKVIKNFELERLTVKL